MARKVVVAEVPAEETEVKAVSGEVVETDAEAQEREALQQASIAELGELEGQARNAFAGYVENAAQVALSRIAIGRALLLIKVKALWKVATDADGNTYKTWGAYLDGAWDWNLSRTAADKMIADAKPLAIEAGEIEPDAEADAKNVRVAPMLTVVKYAEASIVALDKFEEAWANRANRIGNGNGADAARLSADAMFDFLAEHRNSLVAMLTVTDEVAEGETADEALAAEETDDSLAD